ncbi:hypothetical protein QA640_45290 (plasmid) [Bradyrhizobium sp. CB82]|uniref:hypothetical protein n=1 Tax=Bradyrhizobium sp. CB82 TaxID=3039159 RepID=UPI0024B08781|nr:hypothetical protein [Bradyrhizobium sp. CB82]WFU45995.1 hypothetical protein QA640_45290 [Bradyrhizobium sp. CB82]
MQAIHSEHGVSIFLNSFAASVEAQADGRVCGVSLSDGRFLPADGVMALPINRHWIIIGNGASG